MSATTAVRTGPDPRATARRARVPLAAAAGLVAVALLVAFVGTGSRGGELDPRSATPAGARALAVLLGERGVDVRRVTDVEGVGGDTTAVVPFPSRLTPDELRALSERTPDGADLVLVAPDGAALDAIGGPARPAGAAPVSTRDPSCELAEARTAGDADLGGRTYTPVDAPDAARCYPAGGRAGLLVLPRRNGRLVLLGTGAPLSNDKLDERGNAALVLGLLGRRPSLVWVQPPAGRPAAVGARRGLADLLPDAVVVALVQLAVGVAVLALWRGRRLGPPVAEPLPVVVRAAEAVEGRARLYAAGRARGQAADALRTGLRGRLADAVGLGATAEPDPRALVAAVAGRTGRPPAQVGALLYGAGAAGGPVGGLDGGLRGGSDGGLPDDAALVTLADDLDRLDRQVRRP